MNAAIYTRVSTGNQNTTRQLIELEERCLKKGWKASYKKSEVVSGSIPYKKRVGFSDLLKHARDKKYEVLVVHEISRLGRNTVDVLKCVQQLNSLSVSVYIMNIDLIIKPDRADPTANLIVAVLASLATHEKELMQQRIISGIRASPKKSGRREGDSYSLEHYNKKYPIAVTLLKDGYPMTTVSELTRISYSTIRRIRKQINGMN
jgi:DNA invertase Pin-like site-specific DNA recombinase